jgi:hypothetical protein
MPKSAPTAETHRQPEPPFAVPSLARPLAFGVVWHLAQYGIRAVWHLAQYGISRPSCRAQFGPCAFRHFAPLSLFLVSSNLGSCLYPPL